MGIGHIGIILIIISVSLITIPAFAQPVEEPKPESSQGTEIVCGAGTVRNEKGQCVPERATMTTEEDVNQSYLKILDLLNKAISSAEAGNENTARNYLRQATEVLENELEPLITNPEAKAEIKQQIDFVKSQLNMQDPSAGGCLIATATYGSELAPQVQQLRELRDNTLLQTQSGSAFMNGFNSFYYSFSPTIADWERQNQFFKEAVKITITPLITSLSLLNYVEIDSESDVLGYGISLILLNVGMYFVLPAVVMHRIKKFF